jgi:hypothetical protein
MISTEVPTSQRSERKSSGLIPTAYLGGGMLRIDGDWSANTDYTPVPGASYGLGLLKEFEGDRVSFVTGARYLRQSGRIQMERSAYGMDVSASIGFGLDSIGIPLLAKFKTVPRGSGTRFTFTVGAELAHAFGLTFGTKIATNYKGKAEERSTEEWSKDGLRVLNALGVAALGLEIPTASGVKMLLELNYNRTLLPINQNSEKAQIYLETLLLSAGLTI